MGTEVGVALIAASAESAADLRVALARSGVAVDVRTLADDFAAGARRLAAQLDGETVVVCDCADDRGCERAFFVCRELAAYRVLLLAIGEGVESEPVEVLAAALRKAMPGLRLAVVTDRVDEAERPSAGERHSRPGRRAVAELLRRIVAEPDWWPPATPFRT